MVELAEIFRQHGPAYRMQFAASMPASHLAAMRAIEQCRTEALGGQVYRCPDCGEALYSYHSCQNRHCPKCQHAATQAWLARQADLLLPTPIFMLTFTLPEELRGLARSHQKLVYNLLFRASASATQTLAQDPRFVGGMIGMIGVLQTWTRDLVYHPHIHYLVPAGGLAPDGRSWHAARHNFFLPVRALSRLFRARLRDGLRQTELFKAVPSEVWRREWVVHCQSVGHGIGALKYLAPYVFRVAISNRRIVEMENGQVTFEYKDAASKQRKTCTMRAEEFIRRFLQHVLPKGFCKVRYYGFFSPGRRALLPQIRRLLAVNGALQEETTPVIASAPRPELRCPACGQIVIYVGRLRSHNRSPP